MDLGDTDSTTSYEEQHSPKNSTTYEHAPCHAGYLRISVYFFNGSLFSSNNIFLNDLFHYMVFKTDLERNFLNLENRSLSTLIFLNSNI